MMNARVLLHIVFATGSILGISYGMSGFIVPVFSKDVLGATYPEIAWIGTVYFIPYMFVPLLVGFLLVRYNNTYLLVAGVTVNAISIFLLSTAESTTEVAIYRIVTGLALSMFWPACLAIISKVSRDDDMAKNLSRFTMFFMVGYMVGPLIGNMLIENNVGYRMLFQIAGVVMAVAMISALVKVRQHDTVSGTDENGASIISIGMFKQFIRYPIVLIMTTYCAISFGAVLAVYPAFLSDSGINDADILLLYFVFGASQVATLALASKLEIRADWTLIGTAFATSVGLVIAYFSDSLGGFVVAMVFLGFGFSVFFPFMVNLILSRNSKAVTGALIGAYQAIFGIGWAAGPILAGYVSEFYGIGNTYIMLAVLGSGIGVLGVIRRKSLMVVKN